MAKYKSTFTGIPGEPDVVFMVYDPDQDRGYDRGEGPAFKTFDEAVAAQKKEVAKIKRKIGRRKNRKK